MEKFIKYKVDTDIKEINNFHSRFTIGPLETSFGITIGNALRRVLLSNVPGAAVFAIKISGVTHEFQAINGIKEDVTQIILNLKQLSLKISDDAIGPNTRFESWPTMRINCKEAGVIKAENIELPIGFDIINKDLYICTKTNSTKKFEMEIYAKQGRGFKSFKENKEQINSLGIIATDSNFCPIIQVGYQVEEIKVSKDKMGDMLMLDINTNGSISPSDSLAYASKILVDHFAELASINEKIAQMQTMEEQKEIKQQQQLSISIDDLELSVRSYNCLKRNGIRTLQELSNMTRNEIKQIKNLGKTSLREISDKMRDYGLCFKKE